MNIKNEILDYASQYPLLDIMPTGGGCDFICDKQERCDDKATLILISEHAGESPDTLTEEASIVVYPNEVWSAMLAVRFSDARIAIDAMGNAVHQAALYQLAAPLLDDNESTERYEARFSDRQLKDHDCVRLMVDAGAVSITLFHDNGQADDIYLKKGHSG